MKIAAVVWNSHVPMLVRASKKLNWVELKLFSSRTLDRYPAKVNEAVEEFKKADIIFLYRSSEPFWESIEKELEEIGKSVPVVCLSHDPSFWRVSTVSSRIVQTCYSYVTLGGEDNFTNMLEYMAREILHKDITVEAPREVPWEGLYHPDAPVSWFHSINTYLEWYSEYAIQKGLDETSTVGILFARHYWVNGNLDVENYLIREIEKLGYRVIPAFSYSLQDSNLGTRGSAQFIQEVFLDEQNNPLIDALVKLQAFLLGSRKGGAISGEANTETGIDIFKKLNVPVFQPVVSYYKSLDEWEKDDQGLASDICWSVAMPEFEGVIEPLLIGVARRSEDATTGALMERRTPIEERCRRLAKRVDRWIRLRKKPESERKIAFILHNNPCASVEGTVGAASNLDSLESVARILKTMHARGYNVNPPENGKDLINTIMERKAISEFRWTTIDEIVSKGGVLARVPLKLYLRWWDTFPRKVRNKIEKAWGKPPGQEMNGVPPAMVHRGDIIVTGISYGNAVVCVQPKRGCAGPRCDGQVCKILHDPDLPPPHQYLATYRYLEESFGADAIVHVGTHGNVEFLPGKGVGLSESCFPDLSIHEVPHLYIYNADNPPEGTIAKRRSYAVLVDHMQSVLTQGGLYDELEELERCLAEYEQAKISEKSRAHALEHMIRDLINSTQLDKEIKLSKDRPFEEIVRQVHEALSLIRNTQIQDGMHILGEIPRGNQKIDFIYSILKHDADEAFSLRKILCRLAGLELHELLNNPGYFHHGWGKSQGAILEELAILGKLVIHESLNTNTDDAIERRVRDFLGEKLVFPEYLEQLKKVRERICDLNHRIEASKEIDSLLSGFEGKYIPAGPSGLITRGRDDILPTGRNFYSLDPRRIPTKAAYKIGEKLAQAVIDKYREEEGRLPENIAIYWMCADIMWSDGEGMGQIFSLIGVRPTWLPDGRVSGFEIIDLEELGRPRVDVTIRVSGITRDNFPNCIELVDEAIQAVAALDEPLNMNFVRKHSLATLKTTDKKDPNIDPWRKATLRIFASKPGTYRPGVNLAVYASAWKDEKDLSDIFVFWNSYAYGKGIFGNESHNELVQNLKTVDVTFNKVVSDEHDLFGCCCYFGTHGGITAAARHIGNRDVKSYYGDTREPEQVQVRDLADEIRRVVRTKLLNPKWIEGMKRHGYKGAGDISKRVGRVYGWESTTQEVDDWIFDEIASTFILDKENRRFFQDYNPWAMEEITRRLLEAESRGLWNANPDVLQALRETYVEMEGWLEEKMGDIEGAFQGGSVDVFSSEDVKEWDRIMREFKSKVDTEFH